MNNTVKEVLEFISENDVKFIRLGFCDPFGAQKNVSIMADELKLAFTNGIRFDAYAINGFSESATCDLFLFPDPSTLTVLPWRPGPGRVVRFYCDVVTPDGVRFEQDSRFVLEKALTKAEKLGYSCQIGAACEFYLFKTDENAEPTYNTIDFGSYLDIAPLDKGENIRREICLTLEEMGLKPEKSHHEKGPGQNEIDFMYSDAMNSADNFLTFKSVVKAIASRNGLYASFMPKPLKGVSGSGLHINISLCKDGQNVFEESFVAGILEKMEEITAFLNPIINSYDRFGELSAPSHISWSHQSRSQLLSIQRTSDNRTKMKLRSPDPSANPYVAFALIISAGIYGVENKLRLSESVEFDAQQHIESQEDRLKPLPKNLEDALLLAEKSSFVADVIGEGWLKSYLREKRDEIARSESASDAQEFITNNYFRLY